MKKTPAMIEQFKYFITGLCMTYATKYNFIKNLQPSFKINRHVALCTLCMRRGLCDQPSGHKVHKEPLSSLQKGQSHNGLILLKS